MYISCETLNGILFDRWHFSRQVRGYLPGAKNLEFLIKVYFLDFLLYLDHSRICDSVYFAKLKLRKLTISTPEVSSRCRLYILQQKILYTANFLSVHFWEKFNGALLRTLFSHCPSRRGCQTFLELFKKSVSVFILWQLIKTFGHILSFPKSNLWILGN